MYTPSKKKHICKLKRYKRKTKLNEEKTDKIYGMLMNTKIFLKPLILSHNKKNGGYVNKFDELLEVL